ncbi:protein YgfX [Usitatibacter palustris]|uniref:protein YgfX n=1 Tax=Usitatibacter palustris TaxID=2732487 RepID=UPI001489219E|nr:protein YgfX [Usitatibacter palustris]
MARHLVQGAVIATLVIVGVTPLPVIAAVGILLWMLVASRRALAVHFAARFVMLDRSRTILWRDGAGRSHSGVVRDGSFVAPWLTIIRWRPEGAWFDRTILVMPDMIEAEAFRHLRVMLRHG